MKQATFHNQSYENYFWSDLGEDIFTLAQEILKDNKEYDRIIALAKGGLSLSRSLVDFLAVENISSFQIQFYNGIGTTENTPVITQSLPVSIQGERVLIFDDIVDKGETMSLASQYIRHHGATSIDTAALITKPWSSFTPTYSARSSEAWVIFPNEIRETIETVTKLWQDKGDSPEVIKQQLLELGFTKQEVALFSSLE